MREILELLIPITAILVVGAAVIIPVLGVTARLALKPVMESFVQMRAGTSSGTGAVEHRLALMEEQIQLLEQRNERLAEELEFQRRLQAG